LFEPQQGPMLTHRQLYCPSCGSPGDALYDGIVDSVFSAPGAWCLKQCGSSDCGMAWLDPMPNAECLYVAYQDYYTHEQRTASGFRLAAKTCYRLALNLALWASGIPRERERAELMYLDNEKPGRLLDIGCGNGEFLARMAKRGWNCTGIDTDSVAVATGRRAFGLDLRVSSVDDLDPAGHSFDVVTASHVLEHVPDPVLFLTRCRGLLVPGGRLVIKTPNLRSYGHRRYGRDWRGLEPPRHLQLFTANALRKCAHRAGLEILQGFTTAVSAETILIASQFIKIRRGYRPGHMPVGDVVLSKALAPILALKARVAWLTDKSCGEELVAVLAAKPGQMEST
jgi:2-polyprenyl-3-methyl-5-hydroxy-6-metoxy-1,4-benzoquinol methylase